MSTGWKVAAAVGGSIATAGVLVIAIESRKIAQELQAMNSEGVGCNIRIVTDKLTPEETERLKKESRRTTIEISPDEEEKDGTDN